MEVSITELRKELGAHVRRAREGEDVIVTDRGLPVARLSALDSTPIIERLEREGIIGPAKAPKQPIDPDSLVEATGPGQISDFIGEQRR